MKKFTIFLLTSALFFSCSMKQEIFLENDGSGKAAIEINLKDFVLPTIEDLAQVSPDVDPDELLAPEKIKEALEKNPNISQVEASRNGSNNLNVSFNFKDFEEIFKESEEQVQSSGLIKIEKSGDLTTLTMTISKETYKGFNSLIPNMDDPTMSALAPDPDMDVSEEEYLDMIGFFFGEDGPGGIKTSNLEMIINVNEKITEQRGGKLLSSKRVLFNIPLIRVLLLDQVLTYSISYK